MRLEYSSERRALWKVNTCFVVFWPSSITLSCFIYALAYFLIFLIFLYVSEFVVVCLVPTPSIPCLSVSWLNETPILIRRLSSQFFKHPNIILWQNHFTYRTAYLISHTLRLIFQLPFLWNITSRWRRSCSLLYVVRKLS